MGAWRNLSVFLKKAFSGHSIYLSFSGCPAVCFVLVLVLVLVLRLLEGNIR
jgi:hypothetical protein